jgi:hypothetical protein
VIALESYLRRFPSAGMGRLINVVLQGRLIKGCS